MHLALWLTASAAVSYASWILTRLLRTKGVTESLIAGALLAGAQMVVAVELLSNFHAVTASGLLAIHLLITACSTLLARARRRQQPPVPERAAFIAGIVRSDLPLTALGAVTLLAGVTTLILAVTVPPNNHDSMTYHMARVGYYLQHHSLDSYPTANLRQTVFPVNSEIWILWQSALLCNDRLAGLIQWLAWIGCILVVRELARQIGATQHASLFAAFAFGTFPEVILQSSSTQNDLISAFLVLCSFYFAGIWASAPERRPMAIIAGIAIGLAAGTKTIALLAVPGFALFVVAAMMDSGNREWRKLLVLLFCCLLGVAAVGSYIYVQNQSIYGNPLGPEPLNALTRADHFDWGLTWNSAGRMLVQALNFTTLVPAAGAGREAAGSLYQSFVDHAFPLLHVAPDRPGSDLTNTGWADVRPVAIHEDHTWFGPVYAWLGLPLLLMTVFHPPRGPARRRTWALSFAALSLWLLVASLLRWQPWHGRLLVTSAALTAPLLARLYGQGAGRLPRLRRTLLTSLCALGAIAPITANQMKPLYGPHSVWQSDRVDLMYLERPQAAALCRLVQSRCARGARVALIPAHGDQYEYPFFGEHFEMRLLPVRIDRADLARASALPECDYVFFFAEVQSYFLASSDPRSRERYFGITDLQPLLDEMRSPGSGWTPLYDANGVGHLFARAR